MRFQAIPAGFSCLVLAGSWLASMTGPGPVVTVLREPDLTVRVREVKERSLVPVPGSSAGFDSSNALVWQENRLIVFSSHERPFRSVGRSLFELERPAEPVRIDSDSRRPPGGVWIESVHAHEGRLYAWYHHEPKNLPGVRPGLTAPRIGQMVSRDNGATWHDQGILAEAPASRLRLDTSNSYFCGGFGDFSVVPDLEHRFLYFLISQYDTDPAFQGIAVARLAFDDLDFPERRLSFWKDDAWQPGSRSGPGTPIYKTTQDWHSRRANAFWGPSVHWNRELQLYILVMNHAISDGWEQDGIYLSYTPRIDRPGNWSLPRKLIASKDWYPQIIGVQTRHEETDREAGEVARLYVKGRSRWQLEFSRPEPTP